MKRAALVLLSTALLVSVGLGVARAAAPKAIDPDNPWARVLADPDIRVESLHEDPYGTNGRRIWGDDRYETAAAISSSLWTPDDAAIVFLATGQNFPDALAAGASTFGLGPVLLVQRDVLPPSTAAEIQRLQPCFVIALGGPNAISDAVINQARGLTSATCEPPGIS